MPYCTGKQRVAHMDALTPQCIAERSYPTQCQMLQCSHCWDNGCIFKGLNKCTKYLLKIVKGYYCIQLWSSITQEMEEFQKQEVVLRLRIKATSDTDIPSCRHSVGRM